MKHGRVGSLCFLPLPTGNPGSSTVLITSYIVGQQAALASLNSDTFAALNKNPVSALMEFAQSRKMSATIEVVGSMGPPHNPRLVVYTKEGMVSAGRLEKLPNIENRKLRLPFGHFYFLKM